MSIMNVIPGWKYISAGVGIVVLLLAGYWVLKTWVIHPSDLPDAEGEALEQACEDLVEQLRQHLEEVDRGLITIAVPDVRRDTSNQQIRKTIEDLLGDDPRFNVATKDVLDGISEGVSSWIRSGNKPPPEKLLREQGELDAAILISLETKHSTAREAKVSLSADLYEWSVDAQGNRGKIAQYEYTAAGSAKLAHVKEEEEEASGGGGWTDFWWALWRMLVSVVGAVAIPFVFLPATDWVTKKGSNALGMAYLGVIIICTMIPWLALMALDARGGTPSIYVFGVILLCASAVWTYKMHDAWSDRI